jgi:hypothetical protein
MRGCWVLVACSDKGHSALQLTFPNSPKTNPQSVIWIRWTGNKGILSRACICSGAPRGMGRRVDSQTISKFISTHPMPFMLRYRRVRAAAILS